MKILHLSDTHGGQFWKHPISPDIDVVCHTGDLCPDPPYSVDFISGQTEWIKSHAKDINKWIGSKPFVYVQGNHDFIEISEFVNAIKLTSTPLHLLGEQWCGMSEVPYINGQWNNEADKYEMMAVVDKVISANGTILLCHTPPSGILSQQWGCSSLTLQLMNRDHRYKAILFGHVHLEHYQQITVGGYLFSNAAVHTDDRSVNLKGFEVVID